MSAMASRNRKLVSEVKNPSAIETHVVYVEAETTRQYAPSRRLLNQETETFYRRTRSWGSEVIFRMGRRLATQEKGHVWGELKKIWLTNSERPVALRGHRVTRNRHGRDGAKPK